MEAKIKTKEDRHKVKEEKARIEREELQIQQQLDETGDRYKYFSKRLALEIFTQCFELLDCLGCEEK